MLLKITGGLEKSYEKLKVQLSRILILWQEVFLKLWQQWKNTCSP